MVQNRSLRGLLRWGVTLMAWWPVVGCKSRDFDAQVRAELQSAVPSGHPDFPELQRCMQERSEGRPDYVSVEALDRAYNPHAASLGLNNYLLQYVSTRETTRGPNKSAIRIHRFVPRFPGGKSAAPDVKELLDRHKVDPRWRLCVDLPFNRILPIENLIRSYPHTMKALGFGFSTDDSGQVEWVEFPAQESISLAAGILLSALDGDYWDDLEEADPLVTQLVEQPPPSKMGPLLRYFVGRKTLIAQKGHLYAHDLTAHVSQAFWPREMMEAWANVPEFYWRYAPRGNHSVQSFFKNTAQNILKRDPEELLISQLDFAAGSMTNILSGLVENSDETKLGKSVWAVFQRMFFYSRSQLETHLKDIEAMTLLVDMGRTAMDEALYPVNKTPVIDALRAISTSEVAPIDYMYSVLFPSFQLSEEMLGSLAELFKAMETISERFPDYREPKNLLEANQFLKKHPARIGQLILERREELEKYAKILLDRSN